MLTLDAYDELGEAFTKIILDPAQQGVGAYPRRESGEPGLRVFAICLVVLAASQPEEVPSVRRSAARSV